VTTVPTEPNPDRGPDPDGHPVASGILNVFGSVIGFVIGAALVAAGGVFGFMGASGGNSPVRWVLAAVFIGLAMAGFAGAVHVLRRPGLGKLFAGFLIGVGIASLCEGICFSAVH
jgi:hypothetical protein